jgi:hypothetical protein
MGMTYQRGAVWWVKYYRNGRPMRESSGSTKESDAIQLLKIREGDIAHGLPVNPKLNRIRFDEAAEDLKTEYAVNGRRSADELERRIFACTSSRTSADAGSQPSQRPTSTRSF